jgi:hypothetical protein
MMSLAEDQLRKDFALILEQPDTGVSYRAKSMSSPSALITMMLESKVENILVESPQVYDVYTEKVLVLRNLLASLDNANRKLLIKIAVETFDTSNRFYEVTPVVFVFLAKYNDVDLASS